MPKLDTYRAKRDFAKTAEPKGKVGKAVPAQTWRFVVQKHAARRLHYDLRLEWDGVFKSWAVTKGPSYLTGEKRLAVHVEDHPLDYGDFEGTIPEGEYGGGTVMVWDSGRYTPAYDFAKGYAKGHIEVELDGEKLKGGWHLVRMQKKAKERQEPWLLIKAEDAYARSADAPDVLDVEPLSVKTGRDIPEIAAGAPARTKRTGRAATARTAAKAKAAAPRRKTRADPMPQEVAPALATLVPAAPVGSGWIHEIKWDGYRLIAFLKNGAVVLKTRNGLDWTHRFPGIAAAIAAVPVDSAILDGEAIVEDESGAPSFSALQQALSRDTDTIAAQAVFYAFDLLYAQGEDLRALPLRERKARLAPLVAAAKEPALRFSEDSGGDGPATLRNACRLGLEGIVSKRLDRAYRSGRSDDWVKAKCSERQEFVIGGYVPSTATRNAVGSLVLGVYDGKALIHAGRTGTGFTADSARALARRLGDMKTAASPFSAKLTAEQRRGVVFVRPELVGEVEFRGLTGDGLVRHAAFKGLREDKAAQDVVREMPAAKADAAKAAKPAKAAKAAKAPPRTAAADTVAGVRLTHPDRVLWPKQGLTKQGLAEFYVEIADWLLPHIADRPLALVRCPSGVGKDCFFQKHAWAGLDPHIHRDSVPDDGGSEEVLLVRDVAGVVALVQSGVLEIHPWGAKIGDIERPDRVVFDFDPAEDVPWPSVLDGARDLRERLAAMKLESFPKTTGGKGLHVVVPLRPQASWDEVKAFARGLAETMERDSPARYLAKATKSARTGKIFIDYLRNGRGATAVAAYSTRSRDGAPVSTPLAWDELSPAIASNRFTVANLPTRLASLRQDPWPGFFEIRQTLPKTKTKAKR